MSADVEEAMSGVKRALKGARETIVMMVERGKYGAAIETLAATIDKAFSRLSEALVESMRELREDIHRLTKNVDKLAIDVKALRRGLELEAHMRRSEVGGLRGEIVELRIIKGLTDWFRKTCPGV